MNIVTGVRSSISAVELPIGARTGTPYCEEVCIDDLCNLYPVESPCVGSYTFPRVLRLTILADPLNVRTLDDFFTLGGLDPTRRTTATRAFWSQSFIMTWQPLRPWESAGQWICHAQRDEIYSTQDNYNSPCDWLEAILTFSRGSASPILGCFSFEAQYQSTGDYEVANYGPGGSSPYLDTAVSTLSPLFLRFRGDHTGWNGLTSSWNPDGGWYITE